MGNTTQKMKSGSSQHFDYNIPTNNQISTVRSQIVSDIINPEGVRDRSSRDQVSKSRITATDVAIDQRSRPVQYMFFDPDNMQRLIDMALTLKVYRETEVLKSMKAVYARLEHQISNVDVTNRSEVLQKVQQLNAETIADLKKQHNIFIPQQPRVTSHLKSVYHLPDTTDNNKEFRRDNR